MPCIAISRRGLANGLTGVLAAAMLAGCATHVAPSATVSAAEAQAAMASGKHERAIKHAEAAVGAEPRNADFRAMLGHAYLDAGRFVSASNTFSDAFALGDRSPGTALSYALALTGAGLHNEALAVLSAYEGKIPAADLGLAITLAESPNNGIRVLEDSIRSGDSTVRIRQNLAYSYALAGRWRDARVMAAQDLRPDLVDQRMEEWNRTASPLAWQQRVAGLLDVPAGVRDPGQPAQLALANNPSVDQLAAEAVAAAPLPAPVRTAEAKPASAPVMAAGPSTAGALSLTMPDLFDIAPIGPRVATVAIESAFDAALSVPAQPRSPATMPSRPAASAPQMDNTHLVQLGSFANRQSAERSRSIFIELHPELAGHRMVITEAVVGGKRYWRVSAAGFDAATSRAMCGALRARGEGCFAYAAKSPLPGAVRSSVMLARR